MGGQFLTILAAAGLVASGAAASATRSSSALPPVVMAQAGVGNQCVVRVFRTAAAGSFDVTRDVLNDGTCVCNVLTGAAAGNGSVEKQVGDIVRDRTCEGAPPAAEHAAQQAGQVGGQVAGAGAGGGMSGGVLGILLGVVGAGGLATAAGGNGGSDSRG